MNITITFPSGEKQMGTFQSSKVTIGRGKKADFVVIDESLSRVHCQIELIKSEFFVTDLGSSNGVFLDGKKIPPNVKTPFTTFLAMTLGQLECQVSDSVNAKLSYDEFLKNRPSQTESMNISTRPTRKINREAFNDPAPLPKAKVEKGNRTFPLIVTLALIGFGFAAYLQFSGERPAPEVYPETKAAPQASSAAANTNVTNKNYPPDKFLTLDEYRSLKDKSSCTQFQAKCQEFKLTAEAKEGIFQIANSYYYFIDADKLSKDSIFGYIRENPERDIITLLYYFIRSNSVNEYRNEIIASIHFVMMNDKGEMFKVYRLHQNLINFQKIQISHLNMAIEHALKKNDTKGVWTAMGSQIPSINLP